jgi:hypothetical protein
LAQFRRARDRSSCLEVLRSRQLGQGSLIPFAMLAFFYVLVTLSFGFEARKARKLLSEVFETEALDGKLQNREP